MLRQVDTQKESSSGGPAPDTLDAFMQVKDVGVLSALRQVTKQEGLKSLWKGNLITITHRIPYSAINFATYEVAKEQYRRLHVSDMTRRILSGATAGFMACIVVSMLRLPAPPGAILCIRGLLVSALNWPLWLSCTCSALFLPFPACTQSLSLQHMRALCTNSRPQHPCECAARQA